MKSRFLIILLTTVFASCKKESGGTNNNNNNNGKGENTLTLTIGDEKPIILKGENKLDAEYVLAGSVYEYSSGNWLAIYTGDDFLLDIDLTAKNYPKTSNAIGQYYVDGNYIITEKEYPQNGRLFILDSGKLEMIKIEKTDQDHATIQGSFILWTESRKTGETKKVQVKGEFYFKEVDYDLP